MWRKTVIIRGMSRISLSVMEWSRSGFPLAMIHGLGDASGIWNHLAIRISQQFRVAAVDLRGHGDSDWDPEAKYDSATFVGDFAEVAGALDFERMVVIGHSLGADVAIRFAAAHPLRVAALIVVDFGPELQKEGVDEVVRSLAAMPRDFATVRDYEQWLVERRPLADSTVLRQFARTCLRQTKNGWAPKADMALATYPEFSRSVASDGRYRNLELWPLLAGIRCPTLVVRGGASGVFPIDAANRMVERTLWKGQLATVPAAGHAVMLDNPAEFSAVVIRFLSREFKTSSKLNVAN
jgi:pimeloyl-ACP methyl ester carboxylesterase